MAITPQLIERTSKKYVAMRLRISRDEIGNIVPEIYSEIYAWILVNSISISDAPIIRYFAIDYHTEEVDIDVGYPISIDEVPAHKRIKLKEIPHGTYATIIHYGTYENLFETTAMLLDWGQQQGIKWQARHGGKVATWLGRIEHYLVGPTDSKNPNDWKTEIAILVE